MVSIDKSVATEGWIRQEGIDQIVEKQGKRYAILTEYKMHDFGWKLWKGIQAFFLTLFTADWKLADVKLKNKWEEARTGKERHFVVDRLPPSSGVTTTEKVRLVTTSQLFNLDEEQVAKLNALLFIDNFKEPSKKSLLELERGLSKALFFTDQLSDDDKQTLLSVGEDIARNYAHMGLLNYAYDFRKKIYLELGLPLSDQQSSAFRVLDKLRKDPDIDVVQFAPDLQALALSFKELKGLTAEDKQLILDASEKYAKHYVQLGNFTAAYEIRVNTAKMLLDIPPINEITIQSYIEKFHSPLIDQKMIDKENLKTRFHEHLVMVSDETGLETKVQLLDIALSLAQRYEREGDRDGATEFRKIGYSLFPENASPRQEALKFATQVIADVNAFSPKELENGWKKLLAIAPEAKASTEKASFLKVAQILSDKALNPLDVDRSLSLRVDAAKAIFGSPFDEEALEFLAAGMQEVFRVSSGIDPKNKAELVMHVEFLGREFLQREQSQKALSLFNEAIEVLYPPPASSQQRKEALLSLIDSISEEKKPHDVFALKLEALKMNVPEGDSLDTEALKLIRTTFSEAISSENTRKLDPKSKSTFLSAIEAAAQEFIKANDVAGASAIRLEAAQKISLSPPLGRLRQALSKEHPRLGLKLYPIDTTLFKNHTLSIQRRMFENGLTQMHVEAKLTHPARTNLKKTLDLIQKNPLDLHHALPPGFCTGIEVKLEDAAYQGRVEKDSKPFEGPFSSNIYKDGLPEIQAPGYSSAKSLVIEFQGVGKVVISDTDYLALSHGISIDLDPTIKEGEAGAKIAMMLAALGLEAAMSSPRQEDDERIKILQLFRLHFPDKAYPIERDEKWLNAPIQALRQEIVAQVPEMKHKFKHYLDDHPELIYKQEVYPGQPVWAMHGLANEVKAKGGMGLMAGINGNSFEDSVMRMASMLKVGALSTQDRFQNGIIAAGQSSSADLKSGGAEYVFARLITTSMQKNPNTYTLNGNLQILYDLDLVERCGLVYPADKYGTKDPRNGYASRSSILSLVEECEKNQPKNNEVCIRNRIPPKFMKGVMVNSKERRQIMLRIFREFDLITKDLSGVECINQIPVDQFIHIGEMKEEYWHIPPSS